MDTALKVHTNINHKLKKNKMKQMKKNKLTNQDERVIKTKKLEMKI